MDSLLYAAVSLEMINPYGSNKIYNLLDRNSKGLGHSLYEVLIMGLRS